jgi:hypothetical protein
MATIEIETRDVTEPRRFVTLRITEEEAHRIKASLRRDDTSYLMTGMYKPEEIEARLSPLYKLLRDALDGAPVLPPEKRGGQPVSKKKGWFA